MASGGFGSKNEMISSAFNPIQKMAILRDVIEREKRTQSISSEFHINPSSIAKNRVPKKPMAYNPFELTEMLRNEEKCKAHSDPELQRLIEESNQLPTEKYKWPMTANQVIGWQADEGVEEYKKDKKWSSSLNKCEEVKYAESYVMMSGKSPYAAVRN